MPRPEPVMNQTFVSVMRVTSLFSICDWRRRRVLLVADVVAPRRRSALVVDVEHREVGHEAVGRGAVPVLLARLEEGAVAGADHLDVAAAPLAGADALG